MPGVHTFYDGSRILEPVSQALGVEVDMVSAARAPQDPPPTLQLNLVFCQIISIPMAVLYRNYLSPGKVSRETRLSSAMIVGLVLCYFCYGK